ncbi:hypothetical protein NPIL_22641 [Nephila pilipes]|uniref:Uncharacterized protein n=1 Tax=Nephila pilipes TaxID=299642 RepID=A0A8X6I5Y4_NEPPI|nr:hypothetical protein NPIL_22641 [Nephila pilipes]
MCLNHPLPSLSKVYYNYLGHTTKTFRYTKKNDTVDHTIKKNCNIFTHADIESQGRIECVTLAVPSTEEGFLFLI